MTATRILLVRHAESADPTIFHGAESDVDLSPRGRLQADALARALVEQRPTRLVSSAMRRARETAAAVGRLCRLELQIEPDLHERRVGALSGTSVALTDGVWPTTRDRWIAGELGYAPAGAESFTDMAVRLLPVWRRLTSAGAGETTVIIAHGLVCKVLLLSVLPGWSPADWNRMGEVPNVGVSELVREEGEWRALRLNETPALAVGL
jgi:broad specificity phosphatase PhoE